MVQSYHQAPPACSHGWNPATCNICNKLAPIKIIHDDHFDIEAQLNRSRHWIAFGLGWVFGSVVVFMVLNWEPVSFEKYYHKMVVWGVSLFLILEIVSSFVQLFKKDLARGP